MRLLPATKSTFGKTLDKRLPVLKNLVTSLIMKEQIVTTKARALAVRPIVEMMITNARANKSDLRQEVESWTVNHDKVIPLLYGPLRSRYANYPVDRYHTRIFNLVHRGYGHADMAVVELVDGPRDTLKNLEKYRGELEKFKDTHRDMLFTKPPAELLMKVKSARTGRMDPMHRRKSVEEEIQQRTLVEAGKEKCKYIMESFARQAIGEKLPIQEQPQFWVR